MSTSAKPTGKPTAATAPDAPDPQLPPFVTASTAAKELGYVHSSYLSILCNAGKVPGAYKDGRIWLVPRAWIEQKKEQDAAQGIVRGIRPGGHITTGAGLNRKRNHTITGRPPGRPKKNISPEQQ